MGWTNQAFQLLIVNEDVSGFTGLFIYDSSGNLIDTVASSSGADPTGKPYKPGIVNNDPGISYVQMQGGAVAIGSLNPATKVTVPGGITFTDATTATTVPGVALASPETSSGGRAFVIVWGENQAATSVPFVEVTTVMQLDEQASAPPTPVGGGNLYSDSTGHLVWKGPSGTVTVLAPP